MKTRYDAFTKTTRQSNTKDEIMPTGRGKSVLDNSLMRGAPFGETFLTTGQKIAATRQRKKELASGRGL